MSDRHVDWLLGLPPDMFFAWHSVKKKNELVQSLSVTLDQLRGCQSALKAAQERYYDLCMVCPVCEQYGDGCNCGGVGQLKKRFAIAEQECDEARLNQQATESARIRDNEYLIQQRDAALQRAEKAEAQRDQYAELELLYRSAVRQIAKLRGAKV